MLVLLIVVRFLFLVMVAMEIRIMNNKLQPKLMLIEMIGEVAITNCPRLVFLIIDSVDELRSTRSNIVVVLTFDSNLLSFTI